MRDTLAGRARVAYGDLSDADTAALAATCAAFLDGSAPVDTIPLATVGGIKAAFTQCQAQFQALRLARVAAHATDGDGGAAAMAPEGVLAESDVTVGVGTVDAPAGFAVGAAPAAARPETGATARPGSVAAPTMAGALTPPGTAGTLAPASHFVASRGVTPAAARRPPPDRGVAFAAFKALSPVGQMAAAALRTATAAQKDAKLEQQRLSAEVCTAAVCTAVFPWMEHCKQAVEDWRSPPDRT